jgi:menaquinone-dependent protoporphyrinogen IX oxidase
MKCLVCYVSKTGTTEEIAQRVGKILEGRGIETDVAAIGSAPDIRGYDRIILGSPVNGMKVLPEFSAFLAGTIAGKGVPVDIFIVSYMYEKGREIWKRAIRKEKARLQAKVNPSSIEIFGGRLPGKLPGFARFIFGISDDQPLDMRDWDRIEAWARSLAESKT